MKTKQIGTLLLVLCLSALMLCGCGAGRGAERKSSQDAEAMAGALISSDGEWQGKGGCYKLERIEPADYYIMKGDSAHIVYSDMGSLCLRDGTKIYSEYLRDYAVSVDGVWFVREVGRVNGEYIQDYYITKLGFDGEELERFDISVQAQDIAVGAGEELYTLDPMNRALMVYGMDGTELGSIDLSAAPLEQYSTSLCSGGDGSVWLINDLESGMAIYPVNSDEMSLGDGSALPENTVALSTGTGEHPFLLSTEDAFSYYDPSAGNVEDILYWNECGLSINDLRCFIPDGDGFLCLSVTGLSRIQPAQPGEIKPKISLTLGQTYMGMFDDLAAKFNAENSDYVVTVKDYSEGGALSPDEAQLKLNTALMSGSGPDIMVCRDVNAFRGSGALKDIYTLIDADAELTRDDFYVLEALETDGKLYMAPTSVAIKTYGVLPELFGERSGWTWDEYFEMESKLPPDGVMSDYLRKDMFLQNSLELYAPSAIDWENGTCSFDTPEFIRILRAAKDGYDPNCPEENLHFMQEVNTMMNEGKMILRSSFFVDAFSFSQNEWLNGREMNYIGWPTPDGSCGSVFNVAGVAMSAASDCTEGCWEFLKFCLKSTYAYKPTFEKAMTEAMKSVSMDSSNQPPPLTETQVQRYRRLMEEIMVADFADSTISNIVLEESAPMFNGDKTPEETAALIQSKLSIFVAEHR